MIKLSKTASKRGGDHTKCRKKHSYKASILVLVCGGLCVCEGGGVVCVCVCVWGVTSSPTPTVSLSVPLSACCQQHCPTCQRCFCTAAGCKRHNCNCAVRPSDSAAERAALPLSCPHCKRHFRRQQDLARHSRSCL